jgi:hypothetical protein
MTRTFAGCAHKIKRVGQRVFYGHEGFSAAGKPFHVVLGFFDKRFYIKPFCLSISIDQMCFVGLDSTTRARLFVVTGISYFK